jgi:hypothetical protein
VIRDSSTNRERPKPCERSTALKVLHWWGISESHRVTRGTTGPHGPAPSIGCRHRADDGGRSCRNGSAPTPLYHGRSAWRAEPWWQRILYGPTGCNSGAGIEQETPNLSKAFVSGTLLPVQGPYDLLDFWLAGGEGKRSSDGMEEHIAIVIACIQCKVGLAQQCLNFLPDPQGQGSLRPIFVATRR